MELVTGILITMVLSMQRGLKAPNLVHYMKQNGILTPLNETGASAPGLTTDSFSVSRTLSDVLFDSFTINPPNQTDVRSHKVGGCKVPCIQNTMYS